MVIAYLLSGCTIVVQSSDRNYASCILSLLLNVVAFYHHPTRFGSALSYILIAVIVDLFLPGADFLIAVCY